MVDIAVKLCRLVLKLTGAFDVMMMYDEVDLALSGLLPQFESENAVNLKPPRL